MDLLQKIPSFVRVMLIVGEGGGAVAEALQGRGLTDVYAFESPVAPWPFPEEYFDALLLFAEPEQELLDSILPLLSQNGYAMILGDNVPKNPKSKIQNPKSLVPYAQYASHGASLLIEVRPDYNPILHARELMRKARPQQALDVLLSIPEVYLTKDDVDVGVVSDILVCMLQMDARQPMVRLARFIEAQKMFYQAVARQPLRHLLYQCQAEFWRRIGDRRMARGLLESVLHVAPDEETRRYLDSIPRQAPVVEAPLAHCSDCSARNKRVLFITHPRPHYGLDVLYDGLCRVLGDENVVDFPYKPLLHGLVPEGAAPDGLRNYPCACNHRGRELSAGNVVEQVRAGRFDAILYGDMEAELEQTAMRAIVHAATCPVFFIDQQDECDHPVKRMCKWLDIQSVAGLMKREMLAAYDYGPDVWPLPFAYPDGRVPECVEGPRPRDIFWAGHRQFGLRRLYLERIEAKYGRQFDEIYEQAQYKSALLESRIGINIFGLGHDTVRYWELPAHGCMLLSEMPPIRIPNNFVDGVSAVFFDSLLELEEKLDYYLAHDDERERIAIAGREHFIKYHTASKRAEYLLDRLQAIGCR